MEGYDGMHSNNVEMVIRQRGWGMDERQCITPSPCSLAVGRSVCPPNRLGSSIVEKEMTSELPMV
jgi:hypothetical protein